jgi:hypothetical protein
MSFSLERPLEGLHLQAPALDTATQQENADHMVLRLEAALPDIRERIVQDAARPGAYKPYQQERIGRFLSALDNGDTEIGYTFRIPDAWLLETVQVVARGGLVTVETGSAHAVSDVDDQGNYYIPEELPTGFEKQIAFGAFLCRIVPPTAQLKVVTFIDNHQCPAYAYELSNEANRAYTAHIQQTMQDRGVPQQTFLPLPIREYHDAVESLLIPRLYTGGWGKIKAHIDDGVSSTAFEPSDTLLRTLPFTRQPFHDRPKIYLKVGPEVNERAVHAAALGSVFQDRDYVHLALSAGTPTHYRYYDDLYILLRAAEVASEDRFQVVEFTDDDWSADMLIYALGKKLEAYARVARQQLRKYDTFEHFDPYEYVGRNYGNKEILAEDIDICMMATCALNFLDLRGARGADIGCGPNPYPAMLLAPHCRQIDLLEYAALNRSYMENFLTNRLPPDKADIWNKFEHMMVKHGGNRYKGVIDALKRGAQEQQVHIQPGDVFELPHGAWDIISCFFVIDSISNLKIDSRRALRSVEQALTPEGIAFFAYMLNKPDEDGYQAGQDKLFANVSQDEAEIEQASRDNGLECIVIRTRTNQDARDGYESMAFAITCRKDARIAQKFPELKKRLLQLFVTDAGETV